VLIAEYQVREGLAITCPRTTEQFLIAEAILLGSVGISLRQRHT
jgi:hypothetical protein